MNTRLLMRGSAIYTGSLGLAATFAPQETLQAVGLAGSPVEVLLLQLLGAAWVAIAVLNWMAQGNLIGGVYSRPVAMGNMTYFMIAGLALFKMNLGATGALGLSEWVLVGFHLLFAALFGYVAFTHPTLKKKEKTKA